MPREQWKGFVPPYKPVFMDGWSPALMDDYGTAASNGGGRGKYEGEEAALQDHSDSEQEQRMYRHTGHHQDHTQDRRYGDTMMTLTLLCTMYIDIHNMQRRLLLSFSPCFS